MLKKITHGYVEQVFDPATGVWVSQKFVASADSDDCEWEDEDGIYDRCPLVFDRDGTIEEPYLPFDMVQPEN